MYDTRGRQETNENVGQHPEANAEPVSQTGLQQWILIISLEMTEWGNLRIEPGEQMSFVHLFRIYTAKEVRP